MRRCTISPESRIRLSLPKLLLRLWILLLLLLRGEQTAEVLPLLLLMRLILRLLLTNAKALLSLRLLLLSRLLLLRLGLRAERSTACKAIWAPVVEVARR